MLLDAFDINTPKIPNSVEEGEEKGCQLCEWQCITSQALADLFGLVPKTFTSRQNENRLSLISFSDRFVTAYVSRMISLYRHLGFVEDYAVEMVDPFGNE